MSIKTWKAIYYPKTAKQASNNALSALDHSILKWNGLNKSILKAHEIRRKHYDDDTYGLLGDSSGRDFWVDHVTCALCVYGMAQCKRSPELSVCDACPIKILTGKDCSAEYKVFTDHGNPKPKLLKKVRKQYLAEEKK